MRVLHRVRYAAQFLERIELTFESDRVLGPTFLEDLEILVADGPPLVEISRVQRFELLTEPADTNADGDAPLREHIDGRQHLRRHHRVAVRQDHYTGDQPRGRRQRGHIRHQRQLLEGVALTRKTAIHRIGIGRIHLCREDDVIGNDDGCEPHGFALSDHLANGVGLAQRAARRQIITISHVFSSRVGAAALGPIAKNLLIGRLGHVTALVDRHLFLLLALPQTIGVFVRHLAVGIDSPEFFRRVRRPVGVP